MDTSIHKKLLDIQNELKVPKDEWNDFSKFNYRSAEKILDKVKPLLQKHELTIVMTDDLEHHGDRYYVKASVSISDGKNEITSTALAREQETKKGMTEDQITGSASSYARKYALGGLFAIDDTKDADSMDNSPKPVSKASDSKEPSVKQIAMIRALAKEAGIDKEAVDARLLEMKTSSDASEAIKKLQEMTDGN